MKLYELFAGVPCTMPPAAGEVEVCDLVYDSRKVVPGCAFVCLRGASLDGHDYAAKAVEMGAAAIIAEEPVDVPAPVVVTANTRETLALISANLFGHPAEEVKVIALTGTKGKTTTAAMLQSILTAAGFKVGVIGTLGAQIGGETYPTGNTTPESYEIEKNLRRMADAGCAYCVLEASSIGLQRYRAYGFPMEVGVFTNFSQDHIGGVEHKDMEEYLWAKSLLFTRCKTGVVNIDDPAWEGVTKDHTCTLTTFGFDPSADLYAEDAQKVSRPGFVGMSFKVKGAMEFEAEVAIPGRFNVYNALSAIACCRVLGIGKDAICKGLATVMVKGRVEPVPVPGDYSLFIDYAHNAVSMTSILSTLREYEPKRLICMFGAGGNRPKVRRFEMGEVCGNMADLSVITTDNPRMEEPQDIINDIKTGMAKTNGKYIEIIDRAEAIRWCLENAQPGDIIVLAGKGQEDYQEIKGVKHHFDEREVIRDVLNSMK
ncbi:MAG: UDP-N-acetylmuramoyl-L-alanyl-D-glutamate--2,6-diaminopimelate ligase [Clostridia bacterium]|nr:UDP-N-acetylmuramoyl-L-alanyl-D-glutamate--2,6-diaminopimelate ligase [Clostridia bacterium]